MVDHQVAGRGPLKEPTAPLTGVRVLDMSRLLPGPVCTLHLADLGADVIKVEDKELGDYARGFEMDAQGDGNRVSPLYRMVNRNKRSVALDLKARAGREIFLRLAGHADVIVESFRPGVVDRLGVGFASVAAVNARIVYCSISGYGQTGPYRERAGHDVNYLGYAGVLDQTGSAGGPPTLSNIQISDVLGGAMNAATSILAALFDAQRTGRGRHTDIAMAEGALAYNLFALHALETHGATPARGDALLTGGVPAYNVYATRDGRYLAVGALEEKFWRALCGALGRPDLGPRGLVRGEESAAVRAELTAIFATRTQAEWIARLASVDCCVTPVLTLDEALADAQMVARGMIAIGADGTRQYTTPLKMSEHAFAIRRNAPAHGEQSAEVLREAGYSVGEIAQFTADGVVGGIVVADGNGLQP